jgi:glycerol kinase
MKYTLAIDQSTSATKVMLFDENESLKSDIAVEHKQYYPIPGWVEHDAEEIIRNLYAAFRQIFFVSDIKTEDITSIAITNQRETVVVWNAETGKPIYNAVVWQCQRGAEFCCQLKEMGHADMVLEKTGLVIDPYFSASGVKWILDNVKGARLLANKGKLRLGTIDSWLIWNLTKEVNPVHATDYTNASRTMLFNIHSLDWDDELLDIFTIPRSMMPEVRACDALYGETNLEGLLPKNVPIAGVMGDSHGALFGQMCFEPGMGKATYGTGSSVMVNTGLKACIPPAGLVMSIGYAACGDVCYAFEGNIHCTGDTIKWLVDSLEVINSASESEVYANTVSDNGGVYFVPAFAGLGAPWWNNEARAIICGMSRGSTKKHVVRAALEAIAYQVKDLVDVMTEKAGLNLKELRVDGGPVRNDFLMQFQSDILNANVNRNQVKEASAYGAVLMNALALGRRKTLDSLKSLRTQNDILYPSMSAEVRRTLYEGWKKAVLRASF